MELAEARSVLARALEHPEWLFSQPDAAGRRSDAWGASRRAIHSPPPRSAPTSDDRASPRPHHYGHKYQRIDHYTSPVTLGSLPPCSGTRRVRARADPSAPTNAAGGLNDDETTMTAARAAAAARRR